MNMTRIPIREDPSSVRGINDYSFYIRLGFPFSPSGREGEIIAEKMYVKLMIDGYALLESNRSTRDVFFGKADDPLVKIETVGIVPASDLNVVNRRLHDELVKSLGNIRKTGYTFDIEDTTSFSQLVTRL